MSKVEHGPIDIGNQFGKGLRDTSKYSETQRRMEQGDSLTGLLDSTPPVGLNLRLISEMRSIPVLADEIKGVPQTTAILGLAIVDGVRDFQRFLNTSMQTTLHTLNVVDIDQTILEEVEALQLNNVITLWRDAQNTGIQGETLDIVLRDHLGNCCPPAIDRAIDIETARITKRHGLSFVNITTSDAIRKSPHRIIVPFENVQRIVGPRGIHLLQTEIFDLSQLKSELGDDLESLRGKLLEIEQNESFVIFGEDTDGHGEWFRPWHDHEIQWKRNGFQIIEVREREGNDSHVPPLRCHRHNVILRKVGTNI